MRFYQPNQTHRLFYGVLLSGVLFNSALVLVGMMISNHCLAQEPDYEAYTARFQSTYIWQKKPSFQAAYSGPNSLGADADRSYTATITGYFGFRPWQGAELYLDPEITQGIPFSGLNGTGAFTNGELTRTGTPSPHLYKQRLFLRQTWNLGGGEEKVEAGLNQLAGSVDKNRLVLTLGNFSTLDIFDGNIYAKDPRVQFMNAGFMAPLAYDYAADARGFGYGFAAEWYQDDWVYRIGRMTGPKDPNMLPTDYRIFKHYGDQVEVEHAYSLLEQPGKVRLLGWRDRAKIANFQDALDYLNTHPGADSQTIFAVRGSEKIKYGLGVNVEQAINKDLGFFLRAMKADGHSETLAFTETDASLGTGLSLKGTVWQRPNDTLGVGYLRNTLSDARRRYLEAGGTSFFLGDGHLNYHPEQVFEAYYSTNIWKDFYITADYQRMLNPGYNADRGPVNFGALRFHVEF